MKRKYLWASRLRRPNLFKGACARVRAMTSGQPLILIREPTNPNDANAIIVADLLGKPCGYIERRIAAIVAPFLDNRVIVMAKVTGVYVRRCRIVQLWVDGEDATETASKGKRRTAIDRNRRTIKTARPTRVGVS